VGCDLTRRCALRVKNTSSHPVRGVLLGAGQRLRDRVPDDRMYEARRSVAAEDLKPYQFRRQVGSLIHRDVRHCGRVAKFAAVAQDRERLRQAQRRRVEILQTCAHLQRHVVDATETDDVLEHAHPGRISGSLQGAQKFPQVKRIPAGGAIGQRDDIVVRAASDRVVNDGANRLPAQQRRANRRRRAYGYQRQGSGRGLVRTQCRDERNVGPVEARRQVGELAQRRLVGPVCVIHGQEYWSLVGEVDRQPVEAMQHSEAGVLLRAV
jgi:hypothetical protein